MKHGSLKNSRSKKQARFTAVRNSADTGSVRHGPAGCAPRLAGLPLQSAANSPSIASNPIRGEMTRRTRRCIRRREPCAESMPSHRVVYQAAAWHQPVDKAPPPSFELARRVRRRRLPLRARRAAQAQRDPTRSSSLRPRRSSPPCRATTSPSRL